MNNYELNESDRLTQSKRPKCQSINNRIKKPTSLNFEFKSSLFTEKNKILIEKLLSQHVSQETSFSLEENKDKVKEKKIPKRKKAFSTLKSIMPKSVNTSLLEEKKKDYIKRNEKKPSSKNILINKNNSTISIKNNEKKSSITKCQIKPIFKKYVNISQKTNPNPGFKVQIQTGKNNQERKKFIFNGITKDINKNKTRNNPIIQKQKQNSNLNSSVKTIFKRKKIGNNENIDNIKQKIIKKKNLRNSVDNKNNNLNLITVNTIDIKERKRIISINNINRKSKNKNKPNNLFTSPKYRNTIQYK